MTTSQKSSQPLRKILILASLFSVSELALAHARLLPAGSLKVRDTNPGIKDGPCGPLKRSSNPTPLLAGQQLTVQWEEVVQHPGSYRIAFSPANDQGFDSNILADIPDTQDSRNDLPHSYSTSITIPNQACEACTIQMIQWMTENPANPRPYFSCADIRIFETQTELDAYIASQKIEKPADKNPTIPNSADPSAPVHECSE